MDLASTPAPRGDAADQGILVSVAYDRAINYAFQQNSIPVLRELRVANSGPEDHGDCVVRISTEPAFSLPAELRFASLPAQAEFRAAPVDLILSPEFFDGLREKVAGLLHIDVTAGERHLARRTSAITLLARNEWCGLVSLPEILAAFVLPNDPAVMRILDTAAEILRQHTGRSALNGYQDRSRERVWQQLESIYQAIGRQGIRYINPPASFEETGQKVRFPTEILDQRFATCLDLSLLFAACCEQAGLHPLVLMHHDHAYAGCWLIERTLAGPAIDDQQAVRKLVELEELSVCELTALTSDAPGALEQAELLAARHLQPTIPFRAAIDIKRARSARIHPLPVPGRPAAPPTAESTAAEPAANDFGARAFIEQPAVAPAAPRPVSRIDLWKSRLLDLTLRNRLLNFRPTKGTVQILSAAAEHVEDELAANLELKLAPRPAVMAHDDPRDPELYVRRQSADALAGHLREELKHGRLHTNLEEAEHQHRLTELYRAARVAIEENGTNTLYAAVGVLEWRESEHSDRLLRAPLLLVPVELKRKSVIEGFQLRRIDEETRLNVTLMEMLRQHFKKEIPGLEPLPEDECGVDVGVVFRRFREAVRDLPGWEVKSEIWLGQFSFTKFLLWKDLADGLDALTRNRVVRHLVHEGAAPFANAAPDVNPSQLDDCYQPAEIFCPRSADSSQLAAVMAAAAGHDFVLEGPPGTGKSQTITNIIAHCLAHGKRVLFVAEKRAALDVVHRRLKEEGLAPFCLELHSNKSGKGEVLAQFRESLIFAAQQSPADWTRVAAELQRLRDSLNAYVRSLHRRQPCGLSAHDCLDYLLPRQAEPAVKLDAGDLLECEAEHLRRCRDACAELAQRAELLDTIHGHPLAAVRQTDWSPAWAERTRNLLQLVTGRVAPAQRAAGELLAWLRRPAQANRAQLHALRELSGALLAPHAVGAAFLATPWDQTAPGLDTWIALTGERRTLRGALAGNDEVRLTALELDALQQRWQAAASSPFLLKWIRIGGIRRQLRTARTDGKKPPTVTIPDILARASRLRDVNGQLAAAAPVASSRLGVLWAGGEPDPDALGLARGWGETLHAAVRTLAGDDPDASRPIRQQLADLFAEGFAAFAPGTSIGRRLTTFARGWDEFAGAFTDLSAAAVLDRGEVDAAPDHLAAAARLVAQIESGWRQIRPWCSWQKARAAVDELGLQQVCAAVEDGLIAAPESPRLFERSFRRGLLDALLGGDETLRGFFGHEHDGRIQRFREIDQRVTRLTRDLIRARLAAGLPREESADEVPAAELGLLRKEIAKKTRHLPVRQLLSRITTLMPRLKPCVLMSPLSVAQYLEPGREHFDLVVFDEASQIPVWDAVGAIARGEQLIVVGDPRQLPPTNFFQRSEEENGENELLAEFEDLESILDELLSSGLRHKRLQWHYRSRHEGLIAFSNRQYYENDLLTFPSPDVKHSGVSFRLVESHYDKGKSRTNRGEAVELVDEVVRRLRDPELGRRSYGIVTFSLAQQQLVENLLDEQRRLHPEIETHFGDDPPVVGEPVFVKNLENVQGDERDVILFSICYGPDENGRVSMNFGPLNRDGGERRLNVAITRAKQEIVVFTTLRGDHVDLTRTRARGVRDLKYFLEYAERGPHVLAAPARAERGAADDSEFHQLVADRLRNLGHRVECRVGCSDYRIDLAVVDPSAPERYLLGIECDGETYRRAATARDRDTLRRSVLEGLGWKLHRVWSMDWWHDREGEMARLQAAIAAARVESARTG